MSEPQKQDELKAMQDIVKKLDAMDENEKRRTMTFLADRYSRFLPTNAEPHGGSGSLRERVGGNSSGTGLKDRVHSG